MGKSLALRERVNVHRRDRPVEAGCDQAASEGVVVRIYLVARDRDRVPLRLKAERKINIRVKAVAVRERWVRVPPLLARVRLAEPAPGLTNIPAAEDAGAVRAGRQAADR